MKKRLKINNLYKYERRIIPIRNSIEYFNNLKLPIPVDIFVLGDFDNIAIITKFYDDISLDLELVETSADVTSMLNNIELCELYLDSYFIPIYLLLVG
jgi:hypothetical protein